jgi:NADH dehydrogenase [ubiquinone] 1 alpha subcomplex assembly factor 7
MNQLAAALRDEIRRHGPITLVRYMEAALHHPTLGYYRTRDPLGGAGDFTTAPEISQMFGEMLGAWLAVVWQQIGSPKFLRLVELGPGRGTLMSDALRATRGVPGLHQAIDLHLVETSEPLRATQRAALAKLGIEATWHGDFATVPTGPLLLVANEFFDALPIRQYERSADGWRERLVTSDDATEDGFRFVPADAPAAFEPPSILRDASIGTIWEESPASLGTVRAIAGRLAAHGGAALVIDYGPVQHTGGDSLQALKAHNRHDPLADPGSADITAHVDFAALGQAAQDAGTQVHGPAEQGPFLVALGMAARAERLRAAALARNRPDQAAAVGTAFKRLIAPTEMGSLFKVLALTGPNQPVPPGFDIAPLPETP